MNKVESTGYKSKDNLIKFLKHWGVFTKTTRIRKSDLGLTDKDKVFKVLKVKSYNWSVWSVLGKKSNK